MKKIALFSAFLIFGFHSALADDETNALDPICQKISSVEFPSSDLPSEEDKRALKGCESKQFYYGIGMHPDYVKARKCAFIEKETGDDSVFGGSSVLMMLYANGQGVKRDLDLATKLACKIDGAPLEISGRINHLQALKTKPEATPFDVCDDITSGFMQGQCADREVKLAQVDRDNKIQSLTAKWPQNQREAFTNLRKAATAFFNTRIENEVDLSGTARVAMQSEELNSLETNFEKSLANFERRKLPAFSAQDFKASDAKLNDIFSKIMKTQNNDAIQFGTVTRDKIKTTQKSWILYRDAWVKFGMMHYPRISVNGFKTWLTKERIEQLGEFSP